MFDKEDMKTFTETASLIGHIKATLVHMRGHANTLTRNQIDTLLKEIDTWWMKYTDKETP